MVTLLEKFVLIFAAQFLGITLRIFSLIFVTKPQENKECEKETLTPQETNNKFLIIMGISTTTVRVFSIGLDRFK